MKKNLVFAVIVPSILCLLALKIWKDINDSEELFRRLKKEYPLLVNEMVLNSEVRDTYWPSDWHKDPLFCYVEVANGDKYWIFSNENISSPNIDLREVVSKGSVLQKQMGSDTLTIINDKLKYSFIIDETYYDDVP